MSNHNEFEADQTVERTDVGASITVKQSKPWRDSELVNRLYHDEKMSGPEIAELLGCSVGPIYDRIDETRSIGDANKIRRLREPAAHRIDEDGYERVGTKIDGKRMATGVHRLIAVAEFGFEAVRDKIVHHKNGVPWDNRPSNLQLMDQSDHVREHFEQISPETKREIFERATEGPETYQEIADSMGMSRSTVCTIVARIKRGEYDV